ncbi:hypothetical protein [Mesorhizobium sp.]|uniref:TOTE conflict system archaeo-eukaryotic primase domain-containing protein n=1 Tax=Mesorhizobium sp. TaxID=1871066 RepID=UPI000FE7CFD1|nr:hypothetical protein [Mesorhizobium sp.]RWO85761.1 MAG: hypothetical protein EOQ96_16840 [Mesorhizobium sp.]
MGQVNEHGTLTFADLFQGYEKAHGRFDPKGTSEKGKAEGKALTYKQPPTQALWDVHIAGTAPGLGIIPLRADNTVRWAVIDIDVIGIDHAALEAKCKELGLPLVICRSKSGGAHCFLFTSEPIAAALVVAKLSSWAAALGYGGCEIFPKQTARHDEDDIGNWLNMPYFYAERTTRYCIKDGAPIDLPDFLAYADSMRVSAERLAGIEIAIPDDPDNLFEDGPPCLQFLAGRGGFLSGTRNDGMFNVAIYLKKRFPDEAEGLLNTYNAKMCDPPLGAPEITTINKSANKKGYDYRCRKPPIAAHCNRRECVKRSFGIDDNMPILSLTKLDGDPVLWLFELQGKRILLDTRELMTQKLFQEKVGQAICDYPRTMTQENWEQKIGEAMRQCDVQTVDEDDTSVGIFRQLVHGYARGQARTTTKEQLLDSNSPFITGEGETWFKLRGLMRYLDNQGFKYKSEHHLGQMLRAMHCEPSTERVSSKPSGSVRIWKLRDRDMPPEGGDPEFKLERTIEF